MTDEIIIDGVDVSGCIHLDEWKHCNICKELIKTMPNRHQCLIEQDLRCEYYSDCYYKQLQKTRNAYSKLNNLYNDNCKIIGELEDILQDIKTLVTTDYIQNKKQLVQNYDCLDNFMQKIEDKCSEVID